MRFVTRVPRQLGLSLATATLWLAVGCSTAEHSDPGAAEVTRLLCAQEFRAAVERKDFATAKSLMSGDAHRWWGAREGEGEPWTIGAGVGGPWAAWDDHFRSRKEILTWRVDSNAVTAVVRELNDYYRLLERGAMTTEVTYYFNTTGQIDGLLVRGVGPRPMGKTDNFVAWATANDPEELAALMPAGEVDPTGDHPRRFRRLLERWRQASGLAPIR